MTQHKNSRKRAFVGLIILLVVGLGIGGYYYLNQSQHTQQKQPPGKPENSANNSTNSDLPHEEEKRLPAQYEGTPPATGNTLTGVINYKSIVGNNLVIRVTIDQAIGSGACTLSLTNSSGAKVTKSADISANPSSSTCQGFDIPISELGSGTWKIVIDLTDNGNKSGTISGEITI